MPPTNDFVPFCPTDTGTNLLSQGAYLADGQLAIGNQPGVGRSKLANKALRQATAVSAQVAQLAANLTGASTLDDGTSQTTLLSILTAALGPKTPTLQKFLSGVGTYNKSYRFAIAAGSATVGATYSNNAFVFTVAATIAGALEVVMTGTGAPSVSGTLTKTAGTGDATLTFYAVRAPLYLKCKLVGGGGGGAGSGTAVSLVATDGGNTTFGVALLTANGGTHGGFSSSFGGPGGGASLGTGPHGFVIVGATGQGCSYQVTANAGGYNLGGQGGSTALGGCGGGGSETANGSNASDNSGSGGGGAGGPNTNASFSGVGGGAGGYIEALILSPAATYPYAVGAGGAGGLGAGGFTGGQGGSGLIEVIEYYQ